MDNNDNNNINNNEVLDAIVNVLMSDFEYFYINRLSMAPTRPFIKLEGV